MINTYYELLTQTLAKYEHAPTLNRKSRSGSEIGTVCFYAPVVNGDTGLEGIGCGLGCHIEPAKAAILDAHTGPTAIRNLYRNDVFRPVIEETFDVRRIGIGNMSLLQTMHDGASTVEEFRGYLRQAIAELKPRVLLSRHQCFAPFGQNLWFEDGTMEFDADCTQTTDILTAERYNGVAAKDAAGRWVHGPGPRVHEWSDGILGFAVGLTFLTIDSDGKAVYDYSVVTPTAITFHGDEFTNNLIRVPSHWVMKRIMVEAIAWMCLGEDSGTEFPASTTPEQWAWIRSDAREMKSAEVDELIERLDRSVPSDEAIERAIAISEQEAM